MKLTKKAALLFILLPAYLPQNSVSVVTFSQLQAQAATKQNDTLYVVNFWATWCDPCVKELPYFQTESKKFQHSKVKMILVSLNSMKELAKVQQFTTDKNLGPEVLLLNGGNPNDWIDKIDSSWSGAIPATVMYKHRKKLYFHEGDLTQTELDKAIATKK
ncbi:MAG TPA: TlpA family protein disulfide reductase [Bacteroidia bacterium]|jgi:thiol-disulfide isomerase/thioredoxin|nr:TlpA family protein disulfide reductase [Bacteroidia bacterium]